VKHEYKLRSRTSDARLDEARASIAYPRIGNYVQELPTLSIQSPAPLITQDDAILPITLAATNTRKQPIRRTQQTIQQEFTPTASTSTSSRRRQTIQQTIQQAFTPTALTPASSRRAALAKKEAELYAASLDATDSNDIPEEDASVTDGAGLIEKLTHNLRTVKSEAGYAVPEDIIADDDHIKIEFIAYGCHLPPNIGQYKFMKSVNPSTRVRQFEHLKGPQLYDAIKDLPPWQQMQELFPWFTVFDVLVTYLLDEEGLLFAMDTDTHNLRHAENVLMLIGYPPKLFGCKSTIKSKRQKKSKVLATILSLIRHHTPRTPLPPSGLLEATISIPGPIERTYTVINEAWPRNLLANKPVNISRTECCIIAQMEFFQDEKARKMLISRTFRMNIIDPSIKPWKLGQKITDVNPHITHRDHFLQQHCTPAWWAARFETDPSVVTNIEAIYRFFCREHDRFEKTRSGTHQLLMLLAMGFFSLSDWVEVCSIMNDPVVDRKGKQVKCRQYTSKPIHLHYLHPASANIRTASHRCGNGVGNNIKNKAVCVNPFCVVFEPHGDNISRKFCHDDFAEQAANGIDASETSCFCAAGLEIPCLTGRSNLTAYDLRDQLLEHYNGIRNEHDDKDEATNRIGICPYPGCDFEILLPCNLKTYFKQENANKFVRHFNRKHEADLVEIDNMF
jgi:hypothetical protein